MLLSWLRSRRRRRLLADPAPAEWADWLDADLPFYARLADDERARLVDLARVFLAEKQWEGCDGFSLTDRVRLAIAAQACLLILHIDHDYYRNGRSILVYPAAYEVTNYSQARSGVVTESDLVVLGQAVLDGPVILTWDAVHAGAMNPADGRNVVFHEFAHKLDLLDRYADGTPPVGRGEQFAQWVEVMSEHYDELVTRARSGRRALLDHYAATNPAEFFAVATESFFEKPRRLRQRAPDLYDVLRDYYHHDPLTWQ